MISNNAGHEFFFLIKKKPGHWSYRTYLDDEPIFGASAKRHCMKPSRYEFFIYIEYLLTFPQEVNSIEQTITRKKEKKKESPILIPYKHMNSGVVQRNAKSPRINRG